MKLKICGIRSAAAADFCAKNGVDFVGLNFVKNARRAISREILPEIQKIKIKKVGIFQNSPLEKIERVADFVEIFQFHGDENPEFLAKIKKIFPEKKIWRALPAENLAAAENFLFADLLLFDAKNPGSGKLADEKKLKLAADFCAKNKKKFGIAGGINSENIANFKKNFPTAEILDTASGAENRGIFCEKKVAEIILNFKKK